MSLKIVFIVIFLFILVSLGMALKHMINPKDEQHSKKTANALTFRIGLSLLLFIIIYIALATGLIRPQGIGARIHGAQQAFEVPEK